MTSRSPEWGALPRAFAPTDPFADRDTDQWIARLRGPLATVSLALFLEVLSQAGLSIPHVDSFLILLIAYVAFVDGAAAGISSGALAVLYYAYSISEHGRGFHSTVLPWEEIVIVGTSILVLAGLVGLLRRQLEGARGGEREANHRLSEVVEAMGAGFAAVDAEGRLQYANARAQDFLAAGDRRALESNFWGAVTRSLGPDAFERLSRAAREGRADSFEIEDPRSGAWLDVQAHPITGGVAIHFTDVTQRRRAREQTQALRRMEAIVGLSGGVAHRFNNFLTAIRGYGELALVEAPPESGMREKLLRIHEAAEAATDLVRELQSYSRQQPLQPRSMDLGRAVTRLEGQMRDRLGDSLELDLRSGEAPLQVRIDAGALERVVLDLLEHARRATREGGSVRLALRPKRLEESRISGDYTIRPGDWAILEVRYSAPELDAESQRRIFEPFYSNRESGTNDGLGLASVYGAVKQSGGFIEAEGGPAGTILRVWVPIESSSDPAPCVPRPAPSATPARAAGAGVTILLAEDDEAVRNLAASTLRAAGHTVLEASDAESAIAIEKAHDGPIELLLTDVVMPGRGGRELAREVVLRRPGTSILFMSGYTDERMVRGGIDRGVLEADLAFLQKPFTPSVLRTKVERVLQAGLTSTGV